MRWPQVVLGWAAFWLLLNALTFTFGGRDFRGVNVLIASIVSLVFPFLFILRRDKP